MSRATCCPSTRTLCATASATIPSVRLDRGWGRTFATGQHLSRGSVDGHQVQRRDDDRQTVATGRWTAAYARAPASFRSRGLSRSPNARCPLADSGLAFNLGPFLHRNGLVPPRTGLPR